MAYFYGFLLIALVVGIAVLNYHYWHRRRQMTPAEREYDNRDSYHL